MYKKVISAMLILLLLTAVPCSAVDSDGAQPDIDIVWTDFRGFLLPYKGAMIMQISEGKLDYRYGLMDAEGNIILNAEYWETLHMRHRN
jgi:hypothetical protein